MVFLYNFPIIFVLLVILVIPVIHVLTMPVIPFCVFYCVDLCFLLCRFACPFTYPTPDVSSALYHNLPRACWLVRLETGIKRQAQSLTCFIPEPCAESKVWWACPQGKNGFGNERILRNKIRERHGKTDPSNSWRGALEHSCHSSVAPHAKISNFHHLFVTKSFRLAHDTRSTWPSILIQWKIKLNW